VRKRNFDELLKPAHSIDLIRGAEAPRFLRKCASEYFDKLPELFVEPIGRGHGLML